LTYVEGAAIGELLRRLPMLRAPAADDLRERATPLLRRRWRLAWQFGWTTGTRHEGSFVEVWRIATTCVSQLAAFGAIVRSCAR
jgi:hypothetical protein